MKLHKPLFSVIVILFQLVVSLISYYHFVEWGKENRELDGLITRIFTADIFFLFILIIGFFEMTTKTGWFKNLIRVLLLLIVLGKSFSSWIPIDGFHHGVYNTAWFSAVVAIVFFLFRIGKYVFVNMIKNNS